MALKQGKIRLYVSVGEDELKLFKSEALKEGFEEHQFSQWVNRCMRERINRNRGIESVDRPVV